MVETRVAVPITELSWDDAIAAMKRAEQEGADLIELRLDYIQDRNLHTETEALLQQAVSTITTKPIIFTYRSGKPEPLPNRSAQNLTRLMASREGPLARDYIDFDLRADNTVTLHLYKTYQRIFHSDPQLIVSHHDFQNCDEEEISNVFNRCLVFSPEVIKIAAFAKDISALLTIFNLLKEAQREQVSLIAIAMGEAGRISRVLAPSRGSFLTFASLSKGKESAAGQFTLSELRDIYHISQINEETKVYVLLGNPVGHSVSPHIHNAAFTALGINAVYLPMALTPEELPIFINNFAHPTKRAFDWQFGGASITVPHKLAFMPLMDEIDAQAQRVGAINTINVEDGRLRGYNTDIAGAMLPLERLLARRDFQGLKVAVLGSGGAARAVVAGLTARNASVTIYSRDEARRTQLAQDFAQDFVIEHRPFSETSEIVCDILINTTPIGMVGWESRELLPVEAEVLSRCAIVYDLVYNPLETELLKAARAAGARTIDGLQMLIEQAALQFQMWTGAKAPLEIMRTAAMQKLTQVQR